MKEEEAVRRFSMKADGGGAVRYLKGETLRIEEAKNCELNGQKGWVLMTVDGWPPGIFQTGRRNLKIIIRRDCAGCGGTVSLLTEEPAHILRKRALETKGSFLMDE